MKTIDPPNTLAAGYASLLSPNLTCRAIAAWALLGLSAAQAATSFTFTLPIPARTSAGVYRPDGTLLRTLWNEEPFRAGSHTATWDDKDDAGNIAPNATYTIKVLHHNVEYVWEGRVGNSSRRLTGQSVYNGYSSASDLALAAGGGIFAMDYQEGGALWKRYAAADPQTVSFSSLHDARRQFVYADTDGSRVYFANEGNNFFTDDWPSFTVAYNLSDNGQHQFPTGTSYTRWDPDWFGIIDLETATNEAGWKGSRPTGLAVQKNGPVLAVAHAGKNAIRLFDKNSGSLLNTIPVTAPGRMAFASDNTLWVICTASNGARVVRRYSNVPSAPSVLVDNNKAQDPQDVSVDPNNSNLVIVLDKGTHQVRGFDAATNALWTLGQGGGYAGSPEVSMDKFWFSDRSYLQFAPDGSFWVGDTYNRRTLHFNPARQYLEQIAVLRSTRMMAVDQNNPRRVFGGFLEYEVDATKPLQGNNGSWRLVRNWGWGRLPEHEEFYGLFRILTLGNGRTYALDGGAFESDRNLFELTTTGLRDTGINIFDIYADPNTRALDADGSKFHVLQQGGIQQHIREPLTGFDGSANPVWGAPQVLGSAPMGPNDPWHKHGGPVGARTWLTDGGVAISFSPSAADANTGYHLGGVKLGDNKWLWKTSPTGLTDGKGTFQTHGVDGSVQYAGNFPHVLGRGIIYGYHGEFWEHPRFGDQGQGQANQFMHYWDNGLFVGQFGEPYIVQTFMNPAAIITPGMLAGAGGNQFSSTLVRPGTGSVYLYHGTESASGVFRWRVDGYDSVWELQGNVAKGASGNLSAVVPIAGTGLLAEYFKGKNFEELRSVKVAPEAGFDLGDYSPDPDWLPIDNFSARWSGKVEAPATGVHTFHVTGDDGIRLWVNGQLIVNGWIDQGPTGYSGTINLTAGQKYDIKLEYFESAGGALCRLEWTPPGQPRQVVAKRYLSPAAPGSHGLARGIGLKGEYFSGATKVLERVDAEINWPGLMPWPPLGVPQDNFSVRWTGQLRTIEAGAYLFRAAMDDGMRMRINGQIVLEDWASGGLRPVSGTINLAADTLYDVEVEYYDGTNDHACRIEWERPGSGKSELLPTTRLYPGADSYALVADGIYEIEPVLATGKRLDVAGISAANGASVVLWDDFSSANQRWKAVSVAGNLWEFEPQHAPGKRLDVAGGGSANGTTVHSWDTNSSSAQRWKLINPSGGSFELEPQCAPGKRLGVTGGSSSNGATVQTQDPNGSTAQRWRFLQQ